MPSTIAKTTITQEQINGFRIVVFSKIIEELMAKLAERLSEKYAHKMPETSTNKAMFFTEGTKASVQINPHTEVSYNHSPLLGIGRTVSEEMATVMMSIKPAQKDSLRLSFSPHNGDASSSATSKAKLDEAAGIVIKEMGGKIGTSGFPPRKPNDRFLAKVDTTQPDNKKSPEFALIVKTRDLATFLGKDVIKKIANDTLACCKIDPKSMTAQEAIKDICGPEKTALKNR